LDHGNCPIIKRRSSTMLGRRDPQQSLFSAQNLPHGVPADSFYGRMAAVSAVLFKDEA
jgi:hypothetical protein